jgi:hypothetical protein
MNSAFISAGHGCGKMRPGFTEPARAHRASSHGDTEASLTASVLCRILCVVHDNAGSPDQDTLAGGFRCGPELHSR